MTRKYIWKTVTIGIGLLMSISMMTAQFSGGRGISYDPFIVANADDLNLVRDYPEAYFLQGADISLDVDPFNARDGWLPIGNYDDPFLGSYDGNNFYIHHLYINRVNERDLGLFGYIYDADIKNVNLTGVDILGFYSISGLVGYAYNSRIENCSVSGSVEGTSFHVGALTGLLMYSTITLSRSYGKVRGFSDVGGLVGTNNEGTIDKSGSKADVRGSYGIGGLVGNNYTAGGCEPGNTGGLAGLRYGTYITSSFASGDVYGLQRVGGLVGKSENAYIYNSYATGAVSGNSLVGGFVGVTYDGVIENGYSTGFVAGESFVGGFIGDHLAGRVVSSYWDVNTSRTNSSPAGEGRTTEQMTYPFTENTYINWDFEEIWSEDTEDNINDGYPILIWQIGIINPFPNAATNPLPEDGSDNISINTDHIFWSFYPDERYALPAGFRIYLDTSPDFNDVADFYWVDYIQDSTRYSVNIADDTPLEYERTYYWKVVPTTITPLREEQEVEPYSPNRFHLPALSATAGDAHDAEVWSFTTETETGVEGYTVSPPVTALKGNYPNPFNPATTIEFAIAEETFVKLRIYNIIGQEIVTLIDDRLPPGNHYAIWNGKDKNGNSVSSGAYLYRLLTGNHNQVGKMIMIK